MESIRTRGRRGLRHNDIVVFNYPVNDKGRIGFKMNYVYVKRVVALPGDTISFVHSRPVNSHYEGVLGLPEAQRRLEETPDSLIPWYAMRNILVETAVLGYTIKDILPVYVPLSGRHPADGRLAQGGNLPPGDRVGDGACVGMGR